jgi:hypothetical protein
MACLQITSFSVDKDVSLATFAAKGGTLVLAHCTSARNIQPLSFFALERERVLLPNVNYRVDQAVPQAQVFRVAQLASCASFPPNVDLVVITEL